MKRRSFLQATSAAAVAVVAPAVRAQLLPKNPIKILVGFPPGGGTDALARVIAAKLSPLWGVPIVIENRAGAAGVIAAEALMREPNDGTSLLMGHINSHALGPAMGARLRYDPVKDFQPIGMVGVTPNILIASPAQTATRIEEVIDQCKKNPGRVSFASAGTGSAQHFALEMFKQQAKVFALHIPYRGSGPALTDLMGNQVDYCFETMTAATPHIKSGKLKAIAQTRLKRAKGHPNVPTMDESGMKGFDATVWYGLMGPGAMPKAMAQKMNEDLNKVLALADVQEKMEQYGAEDGGGSIEKFAAFMDAERKKWAVVAKAQGIRPEA